MKKVYLGWAIRGNKEYPLYLCIDCNRIAMGTPPEKIIFTDRYGASSQIKSLRKDTGWAHLGPFKLVRLFKRVK